MNNTNLDKSLQNTQNAKVQETNNGMDNLANTLSKLSMDEIFRELLQLKSKNVNENNQNIPKRNFAFVENFCKISDVKITVSGIKRDHKIGNSFCKYNFIKDY